MNSKTIVNLQNKQQQKTPKFFILFVIKTEFIKQIEGRIKTRNCRNVRKQRKKASLRSLVLNVYELLIYFTSGCCQWTSYVSRTRTMRWYLCVYMDLYVFTQKNMPTMLLLATPKFFLAAALPSAQKCNFAIQTSS